MYISWKAKSLVYTLLFLVTAYYLIHSISMSSIGGTKSLDSRRFVCVSDTHGLHNNPDQLLVPEGDVIIFAGDAGLETERDVQRFEAWLSSLPHAHKAVTFGNMDRAAAQTSDGSLCIKLKNGMVACDEIIEVAGYRIFGSPWTPKYYGQWQLESEEAARQHWSKLLPPQAQIDILVTHGPPFGFGDRTRGRHAGDKALLEAVQSLERPPLLWVVGHIHESVGIHRVPHPAAPNGILLINAATNNLRKGDQNAAPRSVDLPSGVVHEPQDSNSGRGLRSSAGSVWKAIVDWVV